VSQLLTARGREFQVAGAAFLYHGHLDVSRIVHCGWFYFFREQLADLRIKVVLQYLALLRFTNNLIEPVR